MSMWITSNRISTAMAKLSAVDRTPELSIEIFEHAKIIQQLAVENYFLRKYGDQEITVEDQQKLAAVYQSIQFALAQCYMYFSDMLTFGIGAGMIYYGRVDSKNVIVAANSANFAGWAVVFASTAIGDFVRSHFAAQTLYALIDRFKETDSGITPEINGSFKFEKINFSYPSRPDAKVPFNFAVDKSFHNSLFGKWERTLLLWPLA
ncbi:hypothetical protein GCK32_011109 [Trichostrongylus colubriformis]